MRDNVLSTALVHELCPVCAKKMQDSIVMNTMLTRYHAAQVEKLHGKATGFSSEPCQDCQDLKAQGFVLIGVDDSKTTDRANPWRTGHLWVITWEAARRIFGGYDLSKGAAYLPIDLAEHLGLISQEGGE